MSSFEQFVLFCFSTRFVKSSEVLRERHWLGTGVHLFGTWTPVVTAYSSNFSNIYCCSCVDIVFLRSWYPVSVPQLYNPVTSLLLPPNHKDNWSGMRTLGQLKHDLGIHNNPNPDSLYKVEHTQPVTSSIS